MSDSRYFIGTVALLNSLRLTGTDAPLTVLDLGLTKNQRTALEPHVSIVSPSKIEEAAALAKPTSAAWSDADVVIIIDSDIIVTSPLDEVVDAALGGKIVVFPDGPNNPRRSFSDWTSVFELRAPLRRDEIYVNSGFVALARATWPSFLDRWAEACDLVPATTPEEQESHLSSYGVGRYHETYESWPFAHSDQDALNALLMSEIPASSIQLMPYWSSPVPHHIAHVSVRDASQLRCTIRGHRVTLLHFVFAPKPWEPWGWTRDDIDPFTILFPRVFLSAAAPVRLARGDLPLWLARPHLRRGLARAVPPIKRGARRVLSPLPGIKLRSLRRLTGRPG